MQCSIKKARWWQRLALLTVKATHETVEEPDGYYIVIKKQDRCVTYIVDTIYIWK